MLIFIVSVLCPACCLTFCGQLIGVSPTPRSRGCLGEVDAHTLKLNIDASACHSQKGLRNETEPKMHNLRVQWLLISIV